MALLTRDTLLTTKEGFDKRSTIDFWNVKYGVIQDQLVPPTPITPDTLVVSPDGRWMMARQAVATYLQPPIFDPHVIYFWDIKKKRLVRSIDVAPKVPRLIRLFWVPNDPRHIILTYDYDPGAPRLDRFVLLDLRTGLPIRKVPGAHVSYITQMVFAPDGHLMIGVYPPDESQPDGSFDVFHASTLKLVSPVDGDKSGQTFDVPSFFLNSQKMMSGSAIYNIRTRAVTSALPGHPGMDWHCLSPIPGHPGYALLLVQSGSSVPNLELWNILGDKRVKRWPLPRRPRTVPITKGEKGDKFETVGVTSGFVSRDGKAFGFLDDRGIVRIYDYDFGALPPGNSK